MNLDIDTRADIYALGAVFSSACSGDMYSKVPMSAPNSV
jgi:hypothetical protein